MKEIHITIEPTGETVIAPQGYAGGECLAATRELEQRLGEVAERIPTGEACAVAIETEQTHEQTASAAR